MVMKENKDEAEYTVIPQKGGRRCELCEFYKKATEISGEFPKAGTCDRVWGIVDANASCSNYVPLRPCGKSSH